MATVDELRKWRDELIRARASGTRKVEIGDYGSVSYRDDAEMAAAIRDLDRRINQATGASRGPITVRTTKGL